MKDNPTTIYAMNKDLTKIDQIVSNLNEHLPENWSAEVDQGNADRVNLINSDEIMTSLNIKDSIVFGMILNNLSVEFLQEKVDLLEDKNELIDELDHVKSEIDQVLRG